MQLLGLFRELQQIEAMPYGVAAQCDAADEWYGRYMAFREQHPNGAEALWDRIHLNDVWYLARRRFLANQDAT